MSRRSAAFTGLGAVVIATTALCFAASVRLGIVMLFAWAFVGVNVLWAWSAFESFRSGAHRRK